MARSLKPAKSAKRPKRKLQTPNPEVRERLMQAAADIIRARGFPSMRIEEVVENAGLSVGTFYLYFDSKADLFINLVTDYTEQLRERMREAYESEGSATQRIVRGLDVYLDFVEENEKGFLYFVDGADSMMTSAGRLSTWTFQIHADNLLPLLEEAMANNEIKTLNPQLTAQALVGVTQHLATYWLEHRDEISRKELRTFINTFTGFGLAP